MLITCSFKSVSCTLRQFFDVHGTHWTFLNVDLKTISKHPKNINAAQRYSFKGMDQQGKGSDPIITKRERAHSGSWLEITKYNGLDQILSPTCHLKHLGCNIVPIPLYKSSEQAHISLEERYSLGPYQTCLQSMACGRPITPVILFTSAYVWISSCVYFSTVFK